MKRTLASYCLAVIAFLVSPPTLAENTPTAPATLAPVLKKVMPAIVNVSVQGYIPNEMPPQPGEDRPNSPEQQREEQDGGPRKFQRLAQV